MFPPREFIHFMSHIGMPTLGGAVPLTSYLCGIESFGGNDTAADLLGQLRYMKLDGTRLSSMTRHFDLLVKGQGYPTDFSAVWSFMYRNLEEVKKLKVQTAHVVARKPETPGEKTTYTHVKDKVVALSDVFRVGQPFTQGMAELMAMKCFGWDCIGFVSQYLVAIGHLREYPSWTPKGFLSTNDAQLKEGKFKPISDLSEIAPLCVVTFGDAHIVIVDTVHSITVDSEKPRRLSAEVTICQSYTGGPHTRRKCIISQFGTDMKAGVQQFSQIGVTDAFGAKVQIGKNPSLTAAYITPTNPDGVPPFVPGVDLP